MKKLIKIGVTFLLSICCLTPLNINANEDDEYIKTIIINGNEEPLYLTNPDINMYAMNLDGHTYNTFYYTNNYYYFDNSFSCTPSTYYGMMLQVTMSDPIGKGNNIDMDIAFTSNMDFTSTLECTVYYKDITGANIHQVKGKVSKIGASNYIISIDNVQLDDNLKKIELYIGAYSVYGATTSTFSLNGIEINTASESMQVGQILSWLEIINTNLQAINSNISVVVSSLKQAMIDGFSQVGSFITNQTLALENHITQSFNSLNSWISNQTTTISNKLNEVINAIRGDNKVVESKPNLENSTNDLDNTINEYDDIESGLVDDFNTNIGAIKPNNDLITNNDFIKTSTFVATQMTRIYESNSIIQMTITFGLIIGLAFTIIGISVKR